MCEAIAFRAYFFIPQREREGRFSCGAKNFFALTQSYQFAAPNINIIHSHRVEEEYYYVNLCSPKLRGKSILGELQI
jgi:hypothetical protein